MSSYPAIPQKRSRVIAKAIALRNESQQWEEFIVRMLKKLELSEDKRDAATRRYKEFSNHIARAFDIETSDVHVVVQGSMRTQTTIAGDGREKFDLDVVVKLTGPKFSNLVYSEPFFQDFGAALRGIRDAGDPKAKSRCWRLQYPGEPFYFDVTPAIPMQAWIEGTILKVRDPELVWSPSNPEEFADWFCAIANRRFPFQTIRKAFAVDARTTVDPIPQERIGLDDILRRLVQLMKLHRDSYYKQQADYRQAAKPISVILVTLAAKAYKELIENDLHGFTSAIEVALEVVARMPDFIDRNGHAYSINNPALPGTVRENFADKWNSDGGLRAREFETWHTRLENDLEALFSEEYSKRSENRVQAIFGQQGVQAWKASQGAGPLAGLLSGVSVPSGPRKSSASDTFA
ncbi:nucleotidyltransferase domain-containing protein [Bordetella genomosp. 12]|uniref:Nucleotidyltransferase n=1 Tax=Bordetella genomosp. 12 TaxID=463035 RepID=A0A261VCD7_9BORD|nr:nucleotidyltransferase [Bordetella genomosp. 12]OZI71685.1 nucleotidyltransferase [Bordetella genomosp. 12]